MFTDSPQQHEDIDFGLALQIVLIPGLDKNIYDVGEEESGQSQVDEYDDEIAPGPAVPVAELIPQCHHNYGRFY